MQSLENAVLARAPGDCYTIDMGEGQTPCTHAPTALNTRIIQPLQRPAHNSPCPLVCAEMSSSFGWPHSSMHLRNQLRMCVVMNGLLTLVWGSIIGHYADASSGDAYSMSNFIQFGPSKSLNVMGMVIDTWESYVWLVGGIVLYRAVQTWVHEIAHPIIGFRIYDPDKKVIEDFTRTELQVYGNLMYLFDGVRAVFMTMMSITQIDIALWGTIAGEITSIFTIRKLLLAKTFTCEQLQVPLCS